MASRHQKLDQEAFPMLPINEASSPNGFPIHKAAKDGLLDVVQSCIEGNAQTINLMDDKQMSPLHLAAQFNRTNVLVALIKAGTDVNTRGDGNLTALHLAARFNCKEAVEILLSHDADPSIHCSSTGCTPLLVATRMKNTQVVKCLLSKNPKLADDCDSEGLTALHLACMRGSYEICQLVISHGASINKRANDGSTPLVFAVGNKSTEIVTLLLDTALKRKEDILELINGRDNESTTPLRAAITAGDAGIVRLLIEKGASVNAANANKSTPLHMAAANGNEEIVKVLLDKGAGVDAQNSQGRTPLHSAALLGCLNIMKMLLDHKANLEQKDTDGQTPLQSAISSGQMFAVKMLVNFGADVTSRDNEMRTSLHLATINEQFVILNTLLHGKNKELINMPDGKERIPLHYAVFGEDIRILTTLLENGSDCSYKDMNQATPLHLAAEKGTPEHLELILKTAPSVVHEGDLKRNTALHLAAHNRKIDSCDTLLKYGAEVDGLDFEDRTPLFHAAQSGSLPIIELLLDHHANLHQKDIASNTALHMAAQFGNGTIAKALLDKGIECVRNGQGHSCLDTAIAFKASEVINILVKHSRWEELINVNRGGCEIMAKLISHFPDAATLVMDKCILLSKHKPSDPDFSISFDFQFLDPGPDREVQIDCHTHESTNPLLKSKELGGSKRFYGLEEMVKYKRQSLLVHPLAIKLRQIKWRNFGLHVYFFNFLMYGAYAALLTYFILELRGRLQLKGKTDDKKTGCSSVSKVQQAVATITFIVGIIHLLKEFFQMYIQRLRYFTDLQNLLELSMYICGFLFLLPYTFRGIRMCTDQRGMIWRFGTVAVFLSYFNLILLTRNMSFIGMYVTMFIEVFKTMMKVMVLCMLFVFAFALVFFILFKEQDAFDGYGESIVKVMVMTIGEIDYNTLLVDAESQSNSRTGAPYVPYPGVSYVFVFFFVITMPIVLMNLLVGLAVGDIEGIRKQAFLKRIGSHVMFLTEIERRYPRFFTRKLYTPVVTLFPRKRKRSLLDWWLSLGKTLETLVKEPTDDSYSPDPAEERYENLKDQLSEVKDRVKVMMHYIEQQNQMLRSSLVASRSMSFSEGKDNNSSL